jgi:hypothetical protein
MTSPRCRNRSGTGRAGAVSAGLYGVMVNPLHALGSLGLGYALSGMLARPVTARAVAKWAAAYTQAATRPGQATATLLEQAQRQLFEAAEQERLPEDGQAPAGAPAQSAAVQPPRADLAGNNQTVQALIQRGVHPSHAEAAIGNPRLALTMLQRPEAYREPGTAATRVIEQRRAMGTAVGGVQ